jgi:DNA recombination protein RmuC
VTRLIRPRLALDYRVMIAGPTNLAALLTSFQMEFRSLALQKRSSEVWQLLGAIKGEFDKYGDVVSSLARQLNAASNSVDSLGKRTRVMSRKLKDVEVLSDQQAGERILGFAADDTMDENVEEMATVEVFDASARDLRMCSKCTLPLDKLFMRARFTR